MESGSHVKRFLLGLAIALIAGALLLTLVLDQWRSAQALMQDSRSAIITAQSLAEIVREANNAGLDVQPVVAGNAKQNQSLRSIRVIQGARLIASTDPRDSGDKAAP